jgi:CO/xanthine dehydrogenase FAD-binding subunit
MSNGSYIMAHSTDEAVQALLDAQGQGRILAGGTDLLVHMRSGSLKPQTVVDVKHIEEMMQITLHDDGSFTIGAAVSGAMLGESSSFKAHWPGVLEAINLIGSTQVQGRASPGGNLCNASPAGDSVPAMIAAGAVVTVQGPQGRREVPVEQIPVGPGKTSLAHGEIVVSFHLPSKPNHTADAYIRMIPRTEMDIAVVGCAVKLTMDQGVCVDARVGLGAVAPTPLLVPDAAAALVGSSLDEKALDLAAEACRAACNPINDKRGTIDYRVQVAGVLLKRTTQVAKQRAEEGLSS